MMLQVWVEGEVVPTHIFFFESKPVVAFVAGIPGEGFLACRHVFLGLAPRSPCRASACVEACGLLPLHREREN